MSYLKDFPRTQTLGGMIIVLYHLEKKREDTVFGISKGISSEADASPGRIRGWLNKLEDVNLIYKRKPEIPIEIRSRFLVYGLTDKGKQSVLKLKEFENEKYEKPVVELLDFVEKEIPFHVR